MNNEKRNVFIKPDEHNALRKEYWTIIIQMAKDLEHNKEIAQGYFSEGLAFFEKSAIKQLIKEKGFSFSDEEKEVLETFHSFTCLYVIEMAALEMNLSLNDVVMQHDFCQLCPLPYTSYFSYSCERDCFAPYWALREYSMSIRRRADWDGEKFISLCELVRDFSGTAEAYKKPELPDSEDEEVTVTVRVSGTFTVSVPKGKDPME